MLSEFSARDVTVAVLEHLEARRPAIMAALEAPQSSVLPSPPSPPAQSPIESEVETALAVVRAAYREAELPPAYLIALEKEIKATVPAAWSRVACPFSKLEAREFGVWRGGDPVARITYVFGGLVVGGLCVAAPFIPIWEKWFPFALAFAAWWLPSLQIAFQKRLYARRLGEIALTLDKSQPLLDVHFNTEALLSDGSDEEKSP